MRNEIRGTIKLKVLFLWQERRKRMLDWILIRIEG